MISGSLGTAFRASSLRLQSSFSIVSCWSVVSQETVSSCAMPVDSMITSIGFVGMSSPIYKTFFHKDPFLNEIKNLLRCSFFLENVCNSKIKFQYKIKGIP